MPDWVHRLVLEEKKGMNIQEAKEEIKKTVRAYTARTAAGTFRIPVPRQRPVLLIGPPGIGKTAIMEQIAGSVPSAWWPTP